MAVIDVGLKTEGRELERVRHRQVLGMAGGCEKADFGKTRAQPILKTRQIADAPLALMAGDDGLDGGVPAPQVGAAQGPNS